MRHAKWALSVQSNKSEVHDAVGLAQAARLGWFKAVHIKAEGTHLDLAQLKIRGQLIGLAAPRLEKLWKPMLLNVLSSLK